MKLEKDIEKQIKDLKENYGIDTFGLNFKEEDSIDELINDLEDLNSTISCLVNNLEKYKEL